MMEYATRTCKICGRRFRPFMSTQRCCSQECSRKNKNRPNPTPRVTGTFELKTWTVDCVICGTQFTARCQRKPKYCSEQCRRKAHNAKRPYTYEPKEMLEKTCVVCGTAFKSFQNRAKYCSERCANKANSESKKDSMAAKEDFLKRFDPQPRKCPGLPWARCRNLLPPSWPKYRCSSCDKKWRERYRIADYGEGAINDD